MSFIQKISRRSGLVSQMADTVGVDMSAEMLQGTVTAEDVRSAVFRCMSCGKDEACQRWMAEHADGADAAPGYCRNSAMLARLAVD